MSQALPAAPAQKGKSGAARIVGACAALLALAAITLIVLGAVGLANVATANMQGFNAGATVTITDRGMSVYARSDNDRADTVCTAEDGSRTTLARPRSEFSVDVSGSDFYEVARTPDDLAAGSYALMCQGTDQALYVGPAAPNTSATGLLGPAGLITGIVLGLGALGLMIIAIVMGLVGRGRRAGAGGADGVYPYQAPPVAGHSPPAPDRDSTSNEPTQGITYGQGRYDVAPKEHDRGQRNDQDLERARDDGGAADDSTDQPRPYPPPPPPQ